MVEILLVVMLTGGEILSRSVPAIQCPTLARYMIVMPEVTTAWCEANGRVVFSTVSM